MNARRNGEPPTSEAALQADHERYRAIVESQTEAVCRYTADGTITFANAAYSTLFGRTPDEILGLNLFSFIPEEEARQNIQSVIQTQTANRFEHQRVNPDGERRWQQWIDQPIFDDNGHAVEFQGVGRDITEHKRLEDNLKHTEALYRNLARNLPDMGVLLYDHDLRYLLIEGPFLTRSGFTQERNEGKTLFEAVAPEHAQFLQPYYEAALKGEEAVFEHNNGQLIYSGRTTPVRDDAGRIIGGLLVLQDITDRKRIENSLRESSSRFSSLVNMAPVGIFQTNASGDCVYVNDRLCAMLGISAEEALGQGWIQAIHPSDRQRVVNEWYTAAKNQREFALEYRFLRPDKTVCRVQGSAVAIRDEEGTVTGYMGTITDLTSQRDAARSLEESRPFIHKVNQTAPDLIMVFDLSDWGSLYFNQDTAEIFGYTATELQHIGGLPAIMHPEDLLKIPEHFKKLSELGDSDKYEYEFRAQNKSGRWGWYQSHQKVFSRDAARVPMQILAVIRDVSSRKQTEIALQNSEELFRQFAENSRRVFWMRDANKGTLVYLNPSFETVYGVSREDIYSGKYEMFGFTHPEDRASMANYKEILLETGAYDAEFRILRPDGTMRWLLSRVFPIRNEEGVVYRIGGISEDITPRKKVELELQESEIQFRQLAENIEHAFWIISADATRMLYISPAYETIWGRSCLSLYADPQSFAEAISSEDVEHFKEQRLAKMLEGTYDVQYRIERPDGETRWIHSRAFPIRNAEGEVYRIAGVSEDITERKGMEKETFNLALQKENIRLMTDFIRNTSHDLRTPLSTISLGVYMLSRTDDEQKRRDRAAIIDQQIARLNFLIDELHEMSRLDSATQVSSNAVNLNLVIESLIARSTTAFNAKNLRPVLDLKPGISSIKADEHDMGLALKSLLDNAIQYTPSTGSIILRTYQAEDQVVAEIQDTGLGIPSEDLPYIFERFYKVNKSRTGDGSGAGLGLSIAQRVVQMHGGRIEVSSVLGEGSTFRVILPTAN